MRVIAAALFIFVGALTIVGLITADTQNETCQSLPWWGYIAAPAAFIGLTFVAYRLFNPKSFFQSHEQFMAALARDGLIVETTYKAVRAFEVEEEEDEGLHYFVELEDGRVLFLSGQYLYEYEGDEKTNQPRLFPCTNFTLQRHAAKKYLLKIICQGPALSIEVKAPPFDQHHSWLWEAENLYTLNAHIIEGKSYDDLKHLVLNRSLY